MFNRRNFLKSFSLLAAGFVAPAAAVQAACSKTKNLKAGLVTLRGKVVSAGKGIAGVAVTDGISVVRTDSRGAYEIVAPTLPNLSTSVCRLVMLFLPIKE